MTRICPKCRGYKITVDEAEHLLPTKASTEDPPGITCKKCHAKLKATWGSILLFMGLLLAVASTLVSLSEYAVRVSHVPLKFETPILILAAIVGYFLCYRLMWPRIIRLDEWAPRKYWLPKSRIVGYSVYLLLPIAVIMLLFYLGIRR
jgi:uncharacterized integral membrane protein